jgi:hypothetical protein
LRTIRELSQEAAKALKVATDKVDKPAVTRHLRLTTQYSKNLEKLMPSQFEPDDERWGPIKEALQQLKIKMGTVQWKRAELIEGVKLLFTRLYSLKALDQTA